MSMKDINIDSFKLFLWKWISSLFSSWICSRGVGGRRLAKTFTLALSTVIIPWLSIWAFVTVSSCICKNFDHLYKRFCIFIWNMLIRPTKLRSFVIRLVWLFLYILYHYAVNIDLWKFISIECVGVTACIGLKITRKIFSFSYSV